MQAQRMSDAIQRLTVRSQQTDRTIIGPLHEAVHFLINNVGRVFTVLARAACQRRASEWIFARTPGDRAEPLAHGMQ